MNKTLKKVLSSVISASMLCSVLATPHTALADDALPTDGLLMDITFDETGTSSGSFNATVGGTVTEHGSVSYVDNYDGSSKALRWCSLNFFACPGGSPPFLASPGGTPFHLSRS